MIKLPYGISDFYKLVTEDYLYIDRTDRIPLIEEAGQQLLFLRPRRFGKSLWLSTLENYYDIAKADHFERLFGHLAIGKTPTPLHNTFKSCSIATATSSNCAFMLWSPSALNAWRRRRCLSNNTFNVSISSLNSEQESNERERTPAGTNQTLPPFAAR